jgi:hypothetical protein
MEVETCCEVVTTTTTTIKPTVAIAGVLSE